MKNQPKMEPKSTPKSMTNPSKNQCKNMSNMFKKSSANQPTETLILMLPCRRGALLSKSAGFQKIPEDVQIKHENDAKIAPKTVEKPVENPFPK